LQLPRLRPEYHPLRLDQIAQQLSRLMLPSVHCRTNKTSTHFRHSVTVIGIEASCRWFTPSTVTTNDATLPDFHTKSAITG
jgi:hypothetical protein